MSIQAGMGKMLAVAAAVVLLQPVAAGAADDVCVKIGEVPGTSTLPRCRGEIDGIMDIGWGESIPFEVGAGGGGAGKASLRPLKIHKPIDITSPDFARIASSGRHIQNVLIRVMRAGANPFEYMRYELIDAVIVDITHVGSFGSETNPLREVVSFAYGKLLMRATVQNPDGSPGPSRQVEIDVAGGTVQ